MPSELMLHDLPQVLHLFQHYPYDACALHVALQDPGLRLFVDDATSPQAAILCPLSSTISLPQETLNSLRS